MVFLAMSTLPFALILATVEQLRLAAFLCQRSAPLFATRFGACFL
jgi:hypothetical protein